MAGLVSTTLLLCLALWLTIAFTPSNAAEHHARHTHQQQRHPRAYPVHITATGSDDPAVRAHDLEQPAQHVAPIIPHGNEHVQRPGRSVDMPAAPRAAAPSQCPGIPYDFSTSNYCQAALLDSNTYKQPNVPAGVQQLSIKSIQLITRHGDRVPVNIAPHYDAAFDFCDTTASTGYYNNPPPSVRSASEAAAEGTASGSFAASELREKRRSASRVSGSGSNEEGRRLEQIPYLIPVGVTNPYGANLWQGSCATGQLTTLGVQQHITAGQGLRSVYVDGLHLLPPTYSRSNTSFYLRSTDVWRTKQSAEALLSGLWPTQSLEGEDVVPFHSFPLEIETMFANPTACPALANIQAQQFAEQAWVQHLDQPDVFAKLDRIMGTASLPAWHKSYDHFFDNLRVRQCHQVPLPCNPQDSSDCLSQDLADYVYAQGDWEYAYIQNVSPQATRLAQVGISGFMAVIRDTLVAQASGDASKSTIGNPTFAYYSGHDTTLSAVLGALNVTGMTWPPYASQMIWELWQNPQAQPAPPQPPNTDQMWVRIIYNSQTLKLFAAGCCDELCPYQSVVNYLNSMIPPNVADICQASRFDGGQ